MRVIYFVIICLLHIWALFQYTSAWHYERCEKVREPSGIISASVKHKRYTPKSYYEKCWIIDVPKTKYIVLQLNQLDLGSEECYVAYVLVKVSETKEYSFCSRDRVWNAIRAESDLRIDYYFRGSSDSSFEMSYKIESQLCDSMDHFRCSNHSCILSYKKCNGVKDCENGEDEMECETAISTVTANEIRRVNITAIRGVRLILKNAISWIKGERSASFGWGVNTHRAVTALYLSGEANFEKTSLEEELMAKQLELQTALALLRNSSSILSINELSMFVNALTVSCHNPRQFYGYDLINILGERVHTSKYSIPGAYLTLCNANCSFSEYHIKKVVNILSMHSGYPFQRDIQAMTVMALTCIKEKTNGFYNVPNATEMYNTIVKNLIASQNHKGSFGNAHTTALVAQALLSCGQEYNDAWNVTATVNYLMAELNSSSPDFLTATLSLPVLNSKSLVNIGNVNCIKQRKHGETEITGVINELGGKMQVKYSLFIGDEKYIIHTIILRMPENSSAYDLMKVAEIADPKYRFLHTDISGHMYVHKIAGITNDPEAGKFWFLYTGHTSDNETITHWNISPDKLILNDTEHFIMWYKTAHSED